MCQLGITNDRGELIREKKNQIVSYVNMEVEMDSVLLRQGTRTSNGLKHELRCWHEQFYCTLHRTTVSTVDYIHTDV